MAPLNSITHFRKNVENETSSPELEVSEVRKRIWANAKDNNDINDINDDSECGGSRINEKKRKRDDDNDGEQGGSRINEMRKKEEEIAKLKWTIKTLDKNEGHATYIKGDKSSQNGMEGGRVDLRYGIYQLLQGQALSQGEVPTEELAGISAI